MGEGRAEPFLFGVADFLLENVTQPPTGGQIPVLGPGGHLIEQGETLVAGREEFPPIAVVTVAQDAAFPGQALPDGLHGLTEVLGEIFELFGPVGQFRPFLPVQGGFDPFQGAFPGAQHGGQGSVGPDLGRHALPPNGALATVETSSDRQRTIATGRMILLFKMRDMKTPPSPGLTAQD